MKLEGSHVVRAMTRAGCPNSFPEHTWQLSIRWTGKTERLKDKLPDTLCIVSVKFHTCWRTCQYCCMQGGGGG